MVGLLFWAKQHRAPMRDTHRSNPERSTLEGLQYLSRFVTSRGKPPLEGSLVRIIQGSRMMRLDECVEVTQKCYLRASVHVFRHEDFGQIHSSSNGDKSGKMSENQAVKQG